MAAVAVRGNRVIPTSEILQVISLKPGDLAEQERLRRDAEAVFGLGWFADVSVRLEGVQDGVRVVFLLVENPVVTEVAVEGNTVISSQEIIQALNIPTGEVLNIRRTREGARAVESLYESRGYVLARVADIGVVPAGDGRLVVRVAEGKVEDVIFKGLTKTKLFVVRRAVRTKTGDVFNIQQVNRDLQRLFELGFFESVQARPRPGSTPDSAILEIEVKEASTGRVGFGLGYSSTVGLVGQIEFGDRNWQGRGQSLSLRAERGLGIGRPATTQSGRFGFSLDFREPHLDDQQTSLQINLFQNASTQTETIRGSVTSRYDLERTGSFLLLGRPLDPTLGVAVRLRSELATITPLPLDPDDPNSPRIPPSLFTPGRTVAIEVSGTRDSRDSRIAPTRGNLQSLAVEFGLKALGGEFSFQKYTGEYIQYVPLGGESVLAGRVSLGWSGGALPLQEQFILGGPTTLRGFSAGRFRGNSMALLNVEYRTPLGGIAPVLREFVGIAFVDLGGAPIAGGEGLKTTYGVGAAFRSPLGLIRLDVGFGPEGTQTWLNLGHPF